MKKIIAIIIFLVLLLSGVFLSIYIIKNPETAVLSYFRNANTPQKIGSRDDLSLGTISKVNGTHFNVKYSDGKFREYVIIGKTRYENGEKSDIIVGKKVGVIGSYDEDNTYIAKIVRFDTSSPLQMLTK